MPTRQTVRKLRRQTQVVGDQVLDLDETTSAAIASTLQQMAQKASVSQLTTKADVSALSSLTQQVTAVAASVPAAASAAPPSVAMASDQGTVDRYARENHTHKSNVAWKEITVGGSGGLAVWVKVDTADFDGFDVGRYYSFFGQSPQAAGASASAGVLRLAYGIIKQRVTIDQLVMRLTTGAAANCQMAVYKSNGKGKPTGNPVVATASFGIGAGASTNAIAPSGNGQLDPGGYFIGMVSDAAQTAIGFSPSAPNQMAISGASNTTILTSTANTFAGWSTPATVGSLPDMTSATLTELTSQSVAAIGFRVASIP